MFGIHANRGTSIPQNSVESSQNSIVMDTIIAVALSALSLITAQAVDRTAPAFAIFLRCAAGASALIWLFRRLPNGNSDMNQRYYSSSFPSVNIPTVSSYQNYEERRPLYEAPTHRQPTSYNSYSGNMPYSQPHKSFPPIIKTSKQNHSMHAAPQSRVSFSNLNEAASSRATSSTLYEAPTYRGSSDTMFIAPDKR